MRRAGSNVSIQPSLEAIASESLAASKFGIAES
jgi:hypothetical protein